MQIISENFVKFDQIFIVWFRLWNGYDAYIYMYDIVFISFCFYSIVDMIDNQMKLPKMLHHPFYHYYSCRIICYNWDTFLTYCILDIYLFLWGIISHSGIWWYFRFIMHLEYFTKFDTLTRSIWCSSGYLMNKLKGNTVTLM